jgi:hypothetical protein
MIRRVGPKESYGVGACVNRCPRARVEADSRSIEEASVLILRTRWVVLTLLLASGLTGPGLPAAAEGPGRSLAELAPDAEPPMSTALTFDGERSFLELTRLTELGQRHYGAPRRSEAIAYLEQALRRHVDEVVKQSFVAKEAQSGVSYTLTNLIGRRNPHARRRLLVGSHFDTRLWAESDSDPGQRGDPIMGANDGSSGVAVLLELLRVVAASPELSRLGLDVVFFDGEEFGRPGNSDYCKGSVHLAQHIRELYPSTGPVAVIVLDMVGDRDLQIFREASSNAPGSKWLNDLIFRQGQRRAPEVFVDRVGLSVLDDQSAFQSLSIPAALIIDLDYPYWHTQGDTLDKVSARSLDIVGDTVVEAVREILLQADTREIDAD